jgi:hypothetical protein
MLTAQKGRTKDYWKLSGRFLCLLLYVASPAAASDVKVIANCSVKVSKVSPADLKSIFWETKTSLDDGSRVEPVLLKTGDAHEAFVRQYTGKTAVSLATYYRSLVFTGKGGMPKVFTSEADLVEYVRKTKGAIGYVSAEANTKGVKILQVE